MNINIPTNILVFTVKSVIIERVIRIYIYDEHLRKIVHNICKGNHHKTLEKQNLSIIATNVI